MPDNAIVLTSCEWVDEVAKGTIKVLEFPKNRKRRIKSLGPGSVILVACRRPDGEIVFAGELIAENVGKIYSRKYSKLVKKGLIYKPQELLPREYVWAITFEYFIKYPRPVPQAELTDVRTNTSSKPISQWPIIGLTYLRPEDIHVIDIIRAKAGVVHYLMRKVAELTEKLGISNE